MHDLTEKIWGKGHMAGVHVSRSWIDKCLTDWLEEKAKEIVDKKVAVWKGIEIEVPVRNILGLTVSEEVKATSTNWKLESTTTPGFNGFNTTAKEVCIEEHGNWEKAHYRYCPGCGASVNRPKPVEKSLEEKFLDFYLSRSLHGGIDQFIDGLAAIARTHYEETK